jgi:phosphoribosylformimino-5-aminoimidazole carboxamide ribotide isomerase
VIIYPAIDLKGGRCVRLRQGDPARSTVYGDDPAEMARRWHRDGATALHVVDLDGSFAGAPRQTDAIAAICRAVPVPVQAGGGVRTLEDIEVLLAAGVARVVIGTKALSADFLADAVARFGERLLPALDCRNGIVAVGGWQESSGLPLLAAARMAQDAGCADVLYTDVGRDGMLAGPDLDGLAALRAVGLRVIASGGVASADDVAALQAAGAAGVIIGRALYDGRVQLKEVARHAR